MSGEGSSQRPGSQLIQPAASRLDLGVMDRVGARMVRSLREAIGGFGMVAPDLVNRGARCELYGQYRETLSEMTAQCRFAMPPIKAGVGMIVPTLLVGQMVDSFYGGSGEIFAERAHLTSAECRIFDRLATRVAEALGAAWSEETPTSATLSQSASDMKTAIFGIAEDVCIQSFALEGAHFGGRTIDFVYPLAGLRAFAAQPAPISALSNGTSDGEFRDDLFDAVLQVRFPLRTIFARAELPLTDLLQLQPGDLIPICLPQHVPVTVGDRLFADATVGQSNGRASIQIERMRKGACDGE